MQDQKLDKGSGVAYKVIQLEHYQLQRDIGVNVTLKF